MLNKRNTDLSDRLNGSAAAKQAQLENFRAARAAAQPLAAAKQAERQAVAAAREERRAERDRLKAAEQARLQAEEDARIAAAEAEARTGRRRSGGSTTKTVQRTGNRVPDSAVATAKQGIEMGMFTVEQMAKTYQMSVPELKEQLNLA